MALQHLGRLFFSSSLSRFTLHISMQYINEEFALMVEASRREVGKMNAANR
jgi:hypothetical protein